MCWKLKTCDSMLPIHVNNTHRNWCGHVLSALILVFWWITIVVAVLVCVSVVSVVLFVCWSGGLVPSAERLDVPRCGWRQYGVHAYQVTPTSLGYVARWAGGVVYLSAPCKSTRRWGYLNGSECALMQHGMTKGHFVSRVLGGPALGANCKQQDASTQDAFQKYETQLGNTSYGLYVITIRNGTYQFCFLNNMMMGCESIPAQLSLPN